MSTAKTFKIIVIIAVAIVFIGVGIWIGLAVAGKSSGLNSAATSPYSAVYLSTGDVYFGKLDWFPSPHLEDAWYLQHTTDASGNAEVNIYPFNKVVWGPSDVIYFNSQQIIFWTPLASDSSVVQIIENPNVALPATPSTGVEPQVEPQVSTSTSSTAPLSDVSSSAASVTSTVHAK